MSEYATNEQEQTAVLVKLVDVSPEIKQGYRPIGVFITEPPEVSFGYCFKTAGKWIAASLIWSALYGAVFGIILAIIRSL